jgi:hypothetical protein
MRSALATRELSNRAEAAAYAVRNPGPYSATNVGIRPLLAP